jgi:hypothetical protein
MPLNEAGHNGHHGNEQTNCINIDIDNRLAPDGFQLDEANGMLLNNIEPEN